MGARTAEIAAKFRGAKAALLAGLAHDLGKYSPPFQARLEGSEIRVDHSTAGAREVVRPASGSPQSAQMAEVVAYAVAGHHAGLPDRHGGPSSLEHRLKASDIPDLDPAWHGEVNLGSAGVADLDPHPDGHAAFQLSFHGRMIFSALVDADRRDTEEHAARTGQEPEKPRHWPRLSERVDGMIEALDAHSASLAGRNTDPTLNAIRNEVLRTVTARGQDRQGVFTLTVPTGGGKTLTVTRFALGHARRWNLDRIVYAIPFTSVIDQTAAILKGVLGEDLILEHHSAIEFPSARDEEDFRRHDESLDLKLRLAMEDWAAPVVVTTNVQLFESLFSHRPSRCRKLHNLANSVIILDEAQTLPLSLLRPCLAALDELARNYGCTIVLCTATQPAVGAPRFQGGLELGPDRELAPDPAGLHRKLRRTLIRVEPKPMSDDDLVTALGCVDQGFVIVNSRRHALALYRAANRENPKGLVHLTTRQYAAHRRAIIAEIKRALDAKKACRLVATSLIEAGIDLDFEAGWRAMAGLESVVQSAGRVNREGRRSLARSILTVFAPADPANRPPPEVEQLAAAMGRLPEHLRADLGSPAAIEHYFREVYWQRGTDELDRIEVEQEGVRRRISVLGAFKLNGRETDFAYRTVGENFRMIQDRMAPVIVARDDKAREVLDRLNRPNASAGSVARDLQTFIVQIPQRDRARLLNQEHVQFRRSDLFGDQFAVLETEKLYTPDVGLLWEEHVELGSRDTIF